MKKLIPCMIVIMCLLSVSANAQGKTKQTDLPYTALYSADFRSGNPAYSKMVLELWKDWDDNKFDRHDYFADSVVMMFADGSVSKGKKQVMELAMKYRGSLGAVKSTVHAWTPLHSNDKNEDVVCIWGSEEDTAADGKTDKKELHEVWWFNKDGKVFYVRQWAAKFAEVK